MLNDLLILLFFLLGSSVYSGLETGIISINKLRLQHLLQGNNRSAQIIQRFLDDPEHMLGTTLIGTNLCNVAFSIFFASLADEFAGRWASLASLLIVTPLVLIFGEYLPKAFFQSKPESRTLKFAPVMLVSGFIFWPISKSVAALARLIVPSPKDTDDEQHLLSRDEIRSMANENRNQGADLPVIKSNMIQSVFDLASKTAREVMIPRKEVTLTYKGTTPKQIIEQARSHSLNRLPVLDPQSKQFVGILHIMDVIGFDPGEGKDLYDLMRPPQYVMATESADRLIPRMQLARQPLLLVQNEKKEVIGLITMQKVLSELVASPL